MTRLRIPDERREGLLALSSLSAEEVKGLFSDLLAQAPHLISSQEIEKSENRESGSIGDEQFKLIVTTLVTLYSPLVKSGKSVEKFVGDVIAAVKKAESDFSDDRSDQLRENLVKLLSIPSLATSAKATHLLYENERLLTGARVLTDIRPVFTLEDTQLTGAIITNTLKIEYHGANHEHVDFFVALDLEDIEDLIAKLTRAQIKSRELKVFLSKAALPLIEGESE